jgi:sensor histidine kinase YesM
MRHTNRYVNQIKYRILFVVLFSFLSTTNYAKITPKTIVINKDQTDLFAGKNKLTYWEDKESLYDFENIQERFEDFQINTFDDIYNSNTSSTYWLYFKVSNKSDENSFRLEFFDFDIEDVNVYKFEKGKLTPSISTGFSKRFGTRSLMHKNPSFDLNIPPDEEAEYYVRIKSNQLNVIEPAIRHYKNFIEYSLKEYLILGIFYGLMFLIVGYNLIYLMILKIRHYLYYVLYGVFIILYFSTQDGLGFQFLWPEAPFLNTIMMPISLSGSIILLLLFCYNFLEIYKIDQKSSIILWTAIILKFILTFVQINSKDTVIFNYINLGFFQICFFFCLYRFRRNFNKIKWFITSFLLFNLFLIISLLEHYGLMTSTIITVYAFNIGVILQFIFLSIGIAESIKEDYKAKNKALTELLITKKHNESLRLTELKQQMNPHFIFNALNSIQSRILTDKKEEASKFLVAFSKLIRRNLELSDQDFISLKKEIEHLKLYLSIESMRLGSSFDFDFKIDESLDLDDIKIPTFILQPLTENAIWHGLMPLNGEKRLQLEFLRKGDNLSIWIKDNGIGRIKSLADKQESFEKESKSTKIIQERLTLIKEKYNKKFNFEIIDIEGRYSGTHIHIFTAL